MLELGPGGIKQTKVVSQTCGDEARETHKMAVTPCVWLHIGRSTGREHWLDRGHHRYRQCVCVVWGEVRHAWGCVCAHCNALMVRSRQCGLTMQNGKGKSAAVGCGNERLHSSLLAALRVEACFPASPDSSGTTTSIWTRAAAWTLRLE